MVEYTRNEIILLEGDESDFLCLLFRGSAKVTIAVESGKELTLTHLHAGELFGVLSFLEGVHRSANVIATEHCQVAIASKDQVLALIKQDPQFILDIAMDLSMRTLEISAGGVRSVRELAEPKDLSAVMKLSLKALASLNHIYPKKSVAMT